MNVNRGQKILIRLRPHHAKDTFYEMEDLIGMPRFPNYINMTVETHHFLDCFIMFCFIFRTGRNDAPRVDPQRSWTPRRPVLRLS